MAEPPEEVPVEFQIEIPPEAEAGTYADFASLWFTPDTFVIDFVAAKQPAGLVVDPDGVQHAILPTKVVARVRIPPSQVFEIAAKLTQTLTVWEQETGRRPHSGGEPGDLPRL